MASDQVQLIVCLLLILLHAGCGGARPVVGGTDGSLRVSGILLSETQVTVHRLEGGAYRPVGFGITDSDGTFQLVTNGAKGPLRLVRGEYRCTLESAGAPVQFPIEYAKPETTPLKIVWSETDRNLELQVH